MIEQTLILLKPDAVQRGLIGRIVSRFEDAGLKLIGMKMIHIDENFSKKHYWLHLNKAFYKSLEDFIISGPIIAMVLEGLHAVELVRKMVGGTEPRTAAPGTIRGDFSHHSHAYTDKKGISIKNLIHASGNLEEAKQEVALWFKPNELFKYETVHERHTL